MIDIFFRPPVYGPVLVTSIPLRFDGNRRKDRKRGQGVGI